MSGCVRESVGDRGWERGGGCVRVCEIEGGRGRFGFCHLVTCPFERVCEGGVRGCGCMRVCVRACV